MCVYNGLINAGISPKRNHMWAWKNMLKEINKKKYLDSNMERKILDILRAHFCRDKSEKLCNQNFIII